MASKKELYDEGLTLFGQGKHEEAVEKYQKSLE